MISETEYQSAIAGQQNAQKIINQYHREKQQACDEKIAAGHTWTDGELVYSARDLCPCGHGLAYPKNCGGSHYWDCSAILKGNADKTVEHCAQLPFAFYSIKGESEHNGTTRGVFRPRPPVQPIQSENAK